MKAKFKVGDKVIILDGANIENYAGGWSGAMRRFVGTVDTIVGVCQTGTSERYAYKTSSSNGYVFDERGLASNYLANISIERGTRIDKTCNKKVETITTYVENLIGKGATTCDATDYDAYTGALVAAAKIIASKSEEANLLYSIAINTWGTTTCEIILKTLADRACGGNFERMFNKWQKSVETERKAKCKCDICGKQYETEEDARACEKAHIERKRQKHETYLLRAEAKKRLAEAERDDRIASIMKELISKETNNATDI